MKKLSVLFAAIVCSLVFSIGAKAQAPVDYFLGKWNIITIGTPGGDGKGVVFLERKEGKLSGTMTPEGKTASKFTRFEEKGTTLTCYFTSASGYDVYLYMEKKDDNNITGSMMDMFDVTGVRVIEPKAETK